MTYQWKRVEAKAGETLLPLFEQISDFMQLRREQEALPRHDDRTIRLVRSLFESVVVPEGQRVVNARTPIDVWPPESDADGRLPEPSRWPEPTPEYQILKMTTWNLALQGDVESDEAFVRRSAGWLRHAMRDTNGVPWRGFYIYSLVIGPTYGEVPERPWRLRTAHTKP